MPGLFAADDVEESPAPATGKFSASDIDGSSPQGKFSAADIDAPQGAPPKQYLPEVNQAVASVPRPPVPTGLRPSPAPTRLVQTSPYMPGAPPRFEEMGVGPTPASEATTEAAQRGSQGGALVGGLLTAPVTTAVGLGTSYAIGKGAKEVAKLAGASPEKQAKAEEIGTVVPALAAPFIGLARPQFSAEATPEGTRAAGTILGGKAGAGVAVTPEEVAVRGKVGPFEVSKTFARAPKAPAGPAIEAPTIEGQVAQPTRAEIAEHLDRTNFESPEAAKASYVAEKTAQQPLVEAKAAEPKPEVIQPEKPAPAPAEAKQPITLEASQVEESKPTVQPKEPTRVQEERPTEGAKPAASRPVANEPVSQPGPERPSAEAKPGAEEVSPTPSKEQPAPKPEIVKGGKVELAKDTVVGNRVIPAGTSVTIRYADPNGLVIRGETEDGTKITRPARAFKARVESGAESSPVGTNEIEKGRGSQNPSLAGSEGKISGNEAPQGSGKPTAEVGRIHSDNDGAGRAIGTQGRNGEEVGQAITSIGARPPQESRSNRQPRGEFGSAEQRGTSEAALASPESNNQVREGGRSPGTVGNEVGSVPGLPNAADAAQRTRDVRDVLRRPLQESTETQPVKSASQRSFESVYPPGTLPEKSLTGDALRAWQESIGNPLPKEEDIGAKVRAKAPEPTRAEVKAAAEKKALGIPPAPGKVGEMRVPDLKVAPSRFQYKLSTDAEGVSTLLKETKVFNPDLAGIISVWKDPSDGKTYVINGHHRFELAKRTGQSNVTVRHIVAKDATEARAIGALQNIAEGRGTAIDAAKFFRDTGLTPEDLKGKGISLGEATARDGVALSRLAPEIFSKVVSGDLRQGIAKAIGEGTDDVAQQKAILKQIERRERGGGKVSEERVREFIRLAQGAEKKTETETDLFGSQTVERSLLWEKTEVSEYIKQQLAKDKKLFGFVAKENRASELARAGNKINVEESGRISTEAAQAEEVYNKLSERGGPISSILDESARRLADGENAATVKSEAYQRVRAEVSQTLGGTKAASPERPEGTPESPEAAGQETAVTSKQVGENGKDSIVLFSGPIKGPADSVPLSLARKIKFTVVSTSKDLPSYLRLNDPAHEIVQRAMGAQFFGINMSARTASALSVMLRHYARQLPLADRELRSLADAVDKATHPEFGLNVVRAQKPAHELATVHEELLHAAQRRAGAGSIEKGVPWREMIGEPGIAKMAIERVIPELQKGNVEPTAIQVVAEAMVDLLRGDAAHNLTPEEAAESTKKYFEAMAEKSGIESVQAVQRIQDYAAQLRAKGNIKYAESAEAIRDASQAALSETLARLSSDRERQASSGKTGTGSSGAGKEIPGEKPGGEDLERTARSRGGVPEGPNTSLSAGASGGRGGIQSNQGAAGTLKSTQPIGLTDEELESWSKSKGFRYEPAGEQMGIFGGNDALIRVFRQGPRGREQRALIYQNQLDRLQEGKPEPTEPFQLTGGNAEAEQPRLFGTGDLGEVIGNPKAESGIALPKQEKNDFSLFSGTRGEADLSKLGKDVRQGAEAMQGYLQSTREYTRIARDLQRDLETLDTQKQADILSAVKVMKSMQKEGMEKADDESIYHHLENPNEKLSAKQEEWLDGVINPIVERNEDLYTQLSQGGIPIENYVHRVVKGKGGMLDRIAEGVRAIGQKATLSKSAPQTKHRTYMVLEDQNGRRQVVSVKGGQVTAWENGVPQNIGGLSKTDEGTVFEDKDGNIWNLKQATTKEIERDTDTRYYHSALASTLASNIQLGSAVRAMRFLEAYKNSDDFRETAFDLNSKANPPKGWRTTNLPQFKGYAFEPRTAEVLDWYYDRMRQGNIGALDQIGRFMRVAMLLNPIMHPLNVTASWAVERGATGLLPTTYARAFKAGNRAVKAVLGQNKDFLAALDAGAPLQSHREAIKDISKLFFDQLAEGLGKEEPWAKKVAEALGIEHGNLLNILHKFSSKAAWITNDVLFLQSAYEHQAANPGMSLEDALKETGRVIPEYRVPTRILDSPLLSKLMTNRWATIFGSYHYGLLRSFGEIAKSALGAQEPPPGSTKAQEVAKGWDRLALLALATMLLYPALDQIAKKITKDKHARVKRFGPFALVDAVASTVNREQSVSTTAQRVVTPAPQTKAAAELLMNREFYAGHHIYDAHAPYQVQAEQIGHYLLEQMGQVGQLEKAQTSDQKRKFAYGQAGITFRKTAAEKVASDIAMSKVGTEAEDPEDQQNRVLRREILDQLREGNDQALRDAEAKHEVSYRQVQNLKRRAHLTPLQDTVHGFSYKEIKRVYDAANPEEKKELQPMMHHKLMNLLRSGRREEVTTEAP